MKKWQKIGLACAVLFVIYLVAITGLIWHHYQQKHAHVRWRLDPVIEFGAGLDHHQPAVDARGYVYLCLDNEVACLNPDGTARWHMPYLLSYANVCHEVTADGRLALCETLYDNSGQTPRYHGMITAISSDGRRLWQQPIEYKGDLRGNNVSNRHLYVIDEQALYAFSLVDGTLDWELAIGPTLDEMWPQVDPAGNVYFATDQSELVMVSAAGEELWQRSIPGCADYLPAPTGQGIVYTLDSAGNLSAVACDDGRLIWQQPLAGGARHGNKFLYLGQSHVVANATGQACVLTATGGLTLFTPQGQQLYQYDQLNWIGAAPCLSDTGITYLQDREAGLLAIGPDGQVRWRNSTLTSSQAQPILAGGNLYVMHDRELFALSP